MVDLEVGVRVKGLVVDKVVRLVGITVGVWR